MRLVRTAYRRVGRGGEAMRDLRRIRRSFIVASMGGDAVWAIVKRLVLVTVRGNCIVVEVRGTEERKFWSFEDFLCITM